MKSEIYEISVNNFWEQKLVQFTKQLLKNSKDAFKNSLQKILQTSVQRTENSKMESFINITVIRDLLSKMTTDEVTEAEIRMKELSSNLLQFLPIIESIITSNQQQQWIKTMASSFLNQLFITSLDNNNSSQLQRRVLRILRNTQVKDTNKLVLQRSIKKCLECFPETKTQQWLWLIKQCLSKRNLYSTAFMLLTWIAQAEIPTSLIAKTVTQSYEKILKIQVDVEDTNVINEMIKMWILVIDKLKEEKKMKLLLQKMVYSQPFMHLLMMVYELRAWEETIVCLQQNAEEINFLKQNAANLNKKLLQAQLIKQGTGFENLTNFTQLFFPRLANTLRILAAKKEIIQKTGSQGLLINIFGILRPYLRINIQKFNLEDAATFQNQFLFSFLTIDAIQLRTFEQYPQKFHELAMDCCQRQKFEILKTEAAKFIQRLGDWIQGSLNYSLNRAIQSINLRLGQALKCSFENTQILEMQTSILVISIFSSQLPNYPEQQEAISEILKNEKVKSLSNLELARIFTLLSYGHGTFFKNFQAAAGWIKFALNYRGHPTTRYCALDFLSEIFCQLFDQRLMVDICEMFQTETTEVAWQIVDRIVISHYKYLQNSSLALLVEKLFHRIENLFSQKKRSENNACMVITKCFGIFKTILKQEKVVWNQNIQRKNFVITIVQPILNYYQRAVQMDIDDEVVTIAIQLVNIIDALNPNIANYTNLVINAFKNKRIRYTEKVYFRYFNQVLSRADFQRDKTQVTNIILILTYELYNCMERLKEEKKLRNYPSYRLAISNTLIVLQNAIAFFGVQLNNIENFNFFEKVSAVCMWLLPQQDIIQRTVTSNILNARALNTLFLCHIFQKNESMKKLLTRLKSQNFYHSYDTKVFIMCVDKQIFKETELDGVIFLLVVTQEIVERSLNKDQAIQQTKKKNCKKHKVQKQLQKVADYDKILKNIDSPLKTEKSIYLLLVQLFLRLKKANNQMFTALLQALPAKVYHFYDTLLDFSSLQKNQRIQRVYRKVIGIKMGDKSANLNTTQPQRGQGNYQSDDQHFDSLQLKRERMRYKDKKKIKEKKRQDRKKQHYDFE